MMRGVYRRFPMCFFLILRLLNNQQGPVHAYVAVPGGKTCYLSELKAGKEVIVVDQNGSQRSAIVGRVKIETRPLILVEGKVGHLYTSIFSHASQDNFTCQLSLIGVEKLDIITVISSTSALLCC